MKSISSTCTVKSQCSSQSSCGSTNASFNLKGNKNGKGQTLGSAFLRGGEDITSMESFDSLKGNKNKTGQTLGSTIHTECHKSDQYKILGALSEKQHASLTFKGDKNGRGQTLGSMSDKRITDCDATVKSSIKGMPEDNLLPVVPESVYLSPENVLRQGISYGSDNTSTLHQNHIQSDRVGVPVWDMA